VSIYPELLRRTAEMIRVNQTNAESPLIFDPLDWSGPDSEITKHVEKLSKQWLGAYRAQPLLLEEHTNFSTSPG